MSAKLGWRTSDERGYGPIEYRSTTHPAAGIFAHDGIVSFYVHTAVVGTDMEDAGAAKLLRFVLPMQELERLTRVALVEL